MPNADGAGGYTGSSAHATIREWNGKTAGLKSVPIPVGPSVRPQIGQIKVTKYNDADEDGTDGDPILTDPIFTFQLKNAAGAVVGTASTVNGVATFSNVIVGKGYSVQELAPLPDGWHVSAAQDNPIQGVEVLVGQTTSLCFGNAPTKVHKTFTLDFCAPVTTPEGATYWVRYDINGSSRPPCS